MGPFMILRYLNHSQHFWNGYLLVGPSPFFTNGSVKKTTTKYNKNNIAQIIMRSTESRKQVTQNTESLYKDAVETPFALRLGILVHK